MVARWWLDACICTWLRGVHVRAFAHVTLEHQSKTNDCCMGRVAQRDCSCRLDPLECSCSQTNPHLLDILPPVSGCRDAYGYAPVTCCCQGCCWQPEQSRRGCSRQHDHAGCGTSPGVLLWSPTSECVLATAYVLNATTKMATSMHQMTNRHDTCKCVCHGACTTSVYSAWKAGKQGVKLSILVLLKIIIALLTTRGDQVVYPYHPSLQAVS